MPDIGLFDADAHGLVEPRSANLLLDPDEVYYFLPQEASSNDQGLSVPGWPTVPVGLYSFARTAAGRQVVCFVDPMNDPAFSYADTLRHVTADSTEEPSQTDKVRRLTNLVVASKDVTPWTISDTIERRPFRRVHAVPQQMTDLATRVRMAKAFGDESRLVQAHSHVPLQFQCLESQRLADFLQAPPLSPTSHLLRRKPNGSIAARPSH